MSENDDQQRIRSLETQVAVLQQQFEQNQVEVKNLKGGINRGLWMIGGGFISAFVAWVLQGGLGVR